MDGVMAFSGGLSAWHFPSVLQYDFVRCRLWIDSVSGPICDLTVALGQGSKGRLKAMMRPFLRRSTVLPFSAVMEKVHNFIRLLEDRDRTYYVRRVLKA